MSTRLPVALAALISLFAAASSALPSEAVKAYPCRIVDFGSDVGGGFYRGGGAWQKKHPDADVDGDGETEDDSLAFVPFSLTDPLNPGFPWYDTAATNAVLYGGLTGEYANLPDGRITEGLLNENHEMRDDYNFMLHALGPGQACRGAAVWMWLKRDFLNGGDRHRVTFDANSILAPHISRYWEGLDEGRWLVRDGGRIYLSEQTFAGRRRTHVLRPVDSRWAPYEPGSARKLYFDANAAAFRPQAFRDVTAVGFYVARTKLRRGEVWCKWHAFEARAVVHRPPAPSWHVEMVRVPAGPAAGVGGDVPAFYVGRTEVSYALWRRVWRWAASSQYGFDLDPGYVFDRDGDMGGMDLGGAHAPGEPATDMTWLDAAAWCNALSELEGLTPCYYADADCTEVFRVVIDRDDPSRYAWRPKVYVRWDADGFRLPTAGERLRAAKRAADSDVWEFCWDAPGAVLDGAKVASHTVLGGRGPAPATTPLPFGEHPFVGSFRVGVRLVRREAGLPAPPRLEAANVRGVPVWTFGKDDVLPPAAAAGIDPPAIPTVTVEGGFTRRADGAKVAVSPVHVGRTEVTFAQWNRVYQWAVRHGYGFDADGDMGSMDHPAAGQRHGPDEPVTDITWYDAVLWCNALSEMAGLTPCYTTDPDRMKVFRNAPRFRVAMWRGTKGYPAPAVRGRPITCRWHADGWRLPTEAEWQTARRLGLDGAEGEPADRAWLAGNSGGRTHPVATRRPDAIGLCDLAGNVAERVWDWPGYDYYRARNPKGTDNPNMFGKVIQGSCFGSPEPLAPDKYIQELPTVPRPIFGFRVVRCRAGVHPEVEAFDPPVVLDLDANDFDPLQGRVHRANLHRTGAFRSDPPAELRGVKWRFNTGGAVRSSPVVVGGAVYVGSADGHVYALDAATGKPRWRYRTGGPVHSSAAVADGVVYIGSDDRHLYALDAATGEPRWRFRRHHAPVRNAPGVAYGLVFAGFGTYGGGGLSGIDAATGRERWRYRFRGMNAGPTAPAFDAQTVYAPAADIHLFAADLRTEYPRWRIHGGVCRAPLAVAGGLVIQHGHGRVLALDRRTGMQRWAQRGPRPRDVDRNPTAGPAVAGGVVYTCWRSGAVRAFNLADGQEVWSTATPKRQGTEFSEAIFSSPAAAGKLVLFGCDDGRLYALDAVTGSVRWTFKTGGRVRSSPWVADGTVLVGSDDGFIYALH